MRAHLLFVLALTACGVRPGEVRAHWQGATGPSTMRAVGSAGWCPETRTIVIEATEGDDAVGVVWRYREGGPEVGSVELSPPSDSALSSAAAALRYVHLDEVRGYRSVIGTLSITAADTVAVSGTLRGPMSRVGGVDSTTLDMTFHAVPLTRDATVCVAPPMADTTKPAAADTVRRDSLIKR